MKIPKAKVLKSIIAVDREGGHASIDHELWEKVLWEKESVQELKLPKSEAPKPEVSK